MIKYIPYFKDTIQGQAILDNRVCALKCQSNDRLKDNLRRGMPLYETQKLEQVGDRNENLLIRGECLSACAYLRDKGIEVDLVYIDPPFASGADYAKKVYLRRNPKITQMMEEAESQIKMSKECKSFEEKMYGDIWNKEDYLNWMYENLLAIKSVMSKNASIYVHLDWHIGHYVKILLDEIFGEDNFVNEIVWGYRIQGVGKGCWGRKHDTIFFYKKSNAYIFNPEKENVIYTCPFMDTKVRSPDLSKIPDKEKAKIIQQIKENKPIKDKYKKLLFNEYYTNVFVRDVWDCDDTRPIISGSTEYLDYKTQKPEGLLKRIIKASSNENMIVADFFGGSGVAAAVAHKLKRKFIHVDVGINSIQITRDRLKELKADFEIMEVQDGISLFRNPIQTMDKLKSVIYGLTDNDKLDKTYWLGSIHDSQLGVIPVYVPNLLDSASRIFDKVTTDTILRKAIPKLNNEIKKVICYYVEISDKKEIENFIKDDNNTLVKIELRDLKELLDSVIESDYIEYELKELSENGAGFELSITQFMSDRVMTKIKEYNGRKEVQRLKNGKEFTPLMISESGLELIELISLDCTNKRGEWKSDSEVKIDRKSFVTYNGVKTREFWNGKITCETKPLRLKVRNICGDESIIAINSKMLQEHLMDSL
ncbi:DNA methyltransferase [Helicobacter monodelphidis]|uniref:DNA methyltransferase n=1 Tax=Helicobacter sp. 15-1451 TaxID=2004995 RepID=UPI001C66490F|nr:site-specific DNA-methyltransferase [Helicobacter sp. 15-1451]